MATANTYLKVTDLDFEDIRTNLKTYLSTQDQFRDYNFEGSAMSVLLDVLAYNTHYNAYYLNMLANEMFLDTAQQRESVVSRAKELGYTPTSAIGSSANVQITFTGVESGTTSFTIPRNSTFSTTLDDVTYTYVTPEAYVVNRTDGAFSRAIQIREGEPLTHRWTVSSSNPERYIIPNANVDTSSLVVKVQNSSVDTEIHEFTRATNVNQIYSNSKVYFLDEASDGKYEIVFSQGALGQKVINGNIVSVEYLVCNGDATNGASTFSADSVNIGVDYTSASVTTNTNSTGGRGAESISSIKFNAPRSYQTQNRAIIANDYERIILTENADIESVVAFGGEEAVPAIYGKVYIGVKPYGELIATQNRKDKLRTSILDRSPLGIDPVIIDPVYTYIIPTIKAYYNATTSTASLAEVQTAIKDGVEMYSTNKLERFGNRFRFSRFVRELDNTSSTDILNTDASVQVQKRFTPTLGTAQTITFNFNNKLKPESISTTAFTYSGFTCYMDDDGLGVVRAYRFNTDKEKIIVNSTAGTVDYETGQVIFNSFTPTDFVDTEMKLTATPDRFDLIPLREQILIIDPEDAIITAIPEYE